MSLSRKFFLAVLPLALLIPASQAEVKDPKYHRNYYYPGTEQVAPDEMRVTALGTGMPILRKSQASSSWFVELGNGDKFFFDVGTGSQMNFTQLQVPFRDADKAFLSHLHTDHAGDIHTLWIGGWVSGRFDRPLRVWGPSGARQVKPARSILSRSNGKPGPGMSSRGTENCPQRVLRLKSPNSITASAC